MQDLLLHPFLTKYKDVNVSDLVRTRAGEGGRNGGAAEDMAS